MHYVWAVIVSNDDLESSIGEPFDVQNTDHHPSVQTAVDSILARHGEEIGGEVWDWYRIGGRWAGMFLTPEEREKLDEKHANSDWHYGSGEGSPEDLRLGNIARVRDVPEDFPTKIHGIVFTTRWGVSQAISNDPYDQPFYKPEWEGGPKGGGLWKLDEQREIVRDEQGIAIPSDDHEAFLQETTRTFLQILCEHRDDWVVIVDCHR